MTEPGYSRFVAVQQSAKFRLPTARSLTVQRPLRRGVLGHPLQGLKGAFRGLRPSPRLGSPLFRPFRRAVLTTLVQASLHAADRTLCSPPYRDFDAPLRAPESLPFPGARYRASWYPLGPDFHRLAVLSLRSDCSAIDHPLRMIRRPSFWTHRTRNGPSHRQSRQNGGICAWSRGDSNP